MPANIIVKALEVRSSPPLCSRDVERAFELYEKHKLSAPIRPVKFDQEELREAWKSLEQRNQFEAPVVEIRRY